MKLLATTLLLAITATATAQSIIDTKKVDYFGWHIEEDDTVYVTTANLEGTAFTAIAKGRTGLEKADAEPFYIVDKTPRHSR